MKNIFLNYVVSLLDDIGKEIKYQQERSSGLFNIGHTRICFVCIVLSNNTFSQRSSSSETKSPTIISVTTRTLNFTFDSYYFALRFTVNLGRTFGLAHCKMYVSTPFHTIVVQYIYSPPFRGQRGMKPPSISKYFR